MCSWLVLGILLHPVIMMLKIDWKCLEISLIEIHSKGQGHFHDLTHKPVGARGKESSIEGSSEPFRPGWVPLQKECHLLYLQKIQVLAFSTDCVELIWNLLASLLLARACPSSEQPFVPLAFQHLDWMKRRLLSEVFLPFGRIPNWQFLLWIFVVPAAPATM